MSIIFAILIFSFLIFIHELGHFVCAKLSGVQVNEFALFMGPAIWKKQIGETLYSIRLIPIGGYCAMEGEDEDTDNPRSFQKAAWWKRLVILLAGSAMNLLTGLLIYACLFLPADEILVPEIREFTDCCIFNTEDGLHLGDEILEINGEKVYTNNDISLLLSLAQGQLDELVIRRDDSILTFNDYPMAHMCPDQNGEYYVHYGFGFGVARESNFAKNLAYVGKVVADDVRMVRLSLQMLLTGKAGLQDMSGPVGIVSQMSEIAAESSSAWNAIYHS